MNVMSQILLGGAICWLVFGCSFDDLLMYVVLTHLDGIGPIDPFQFDDTDETDVLPHDPRKLHH